MKYRQFLQFTCFSLFVFTGFIVHSGCVRQTPVLSAKFFSTPATPSPTPEEWIYFMRSNGSSCGIHKVRPDGSSLIPVKTGLPTHMSHLKVSDNGVLMTYSDTTWGYGQIHVLNTDGTNEQIIPRQYGCVDNWAVIWPDASKLLFYGRTSCGSSYTMAIATILPSGTGFSELLSGTYDYIPFDVHVGIGKILYKRGVQFNANNAVLMTCNLDGTNQSVIVGNGRYRNEGDISPDGLHIIAAEKGSGTSPNNILRFNVDGTGAVTLTNHGNGDWVQGCTFSPDSSKIVYSHNLNGGSSSGDLWIMNADGSDKTRITDTTENDFNPVWIRH